jgi:integrase
VNALGDGKQPGDFLFGDVDRPGSSGRSGGAVRARAVPVVSPHGLRGSHAKHAREVGVSGVQLAQAMGHESETTTTEHYAGRGAVANAGIDRVAGLVH